jgi:hypothetical protein
MERKVDVCIVITISGLIRISQKTIVVFIYIYMQYQMKFILIINHISQFKCTITKIKKV